MRTHSSSVKIAKKNAPYGAPQRAVCGFEAVFRLTHTVNQAVIHHDQYSTAGEQATRELKVSEEIFGRNFCGVRLEHRGHTDVRVSDARMRGRILSAHHPIYPTYKKEAAFFRQLLSS